MATRVLDGGALGIVIPHVDTAEEAREIADRLRYPPLGHRSVGGGQAQFDYAPMKMADMIKRSNDNTLITVMIETPKAVRNAEAIAAVPGIDCLLVGSSDLSVEMGIPGENGHPKIQEAVDKVIAACKKHRKFPGMGGAYSEELLQLYIGKGMKLLLAGNDLPMLTNAARTHQAKVRAMAGVRGKAEGGGEEEVAHRFPSISISIRCGLPDLKAAATAFWMSSALVTCVPATPMPLARSTKPSTGPLRSMCM